MRPDLADVRLADRVFAPHCAAALPVRLVRPAQLRAAPDADALILADLADGSAFELLERASGYLWGVAPEAGLVGYLDGDAA